MNTFIVISAAFAFATALPTFHNGPGNLREKKSAPYGGNIASIGAGASAGAYAPPCAPGYGPAPIALYLAPPPGPGLHYRSESENDHMEMRSSENFEHSQARAYGGYDSAGLAVTGIGAGSAALGTAGTSGSAVGLFPQANLGGCAIPLLVSCSPRLVQGHIAKSHSSGYSAPSYRSNHDLEDPANLGFLHGLAPVPSSENHQGNHHVSNPSLVKIQPQHSH